MKTKVFFLGLAMTVSALSMAQKGIQDGSKYGHGEDSVQCMQNLSLFTQYAKQGDYKSAAEFWEKAYADCPQSSKNIYIYGPKIVGYQIKTAKDAAQKEKLFDKLMKVYDDRIKYFGNDRKQGKDYILGRKAIDYVEYVPDSRDPMKSQAYKWLSDVIAAQGTNCEVSVFQQYFLLSDASFKKNPNTFRSTYIDDYMKVTPLLAERAASGVAKDSIYGTVKDAIDAMFAKSGAADCNTLDGVYASQVEEKKSDKDFLNMVLKLYSIANCDKSAVYFKASAYKHAIEPSASSARGLAAQAYSKKDYSKAITYFKEAVELETDNIEKAKSQQNLAVIYHSMRNYSQAKAAAQAAISYNPKSSDSYILIAVLYAENNAAISSDAVIQMTAFWAAVDKLEKAKAVNPSCASTVNKMIATYKEYFPPASELFMRNIKNGDTYTVPGWINEKTVVRAK